MAQIHEPRLHVPSSIAPSATDSDPRPPSPLSYTRFSALVTHTLDAVSLSELVIVKRSAWEELSRGVGDEPYDGGGGVQLGNGEEAPEGTEVKLRRAETRIRELEAKVDHLKFLLAGRITDRERAGSGSVVSWAREEAPSPAPTPAPPTAPRKILHRPAAAAAAAPMTTDRLVAATRTHRRALYVTNLGVQFSLAALLAHVSQGPLERVTPYPARGACLLVFIHGAHAAALLHAGAGAVFVGFAGAAVRWADKAVVPMDWYVAGRIVEAGATRVVRFVGMGGEKFVVEEVVAWWGRGWLVDVKVEGDGGVAVVECESVRDAWGRVQEVVARVKKGGLRVGWEWGVDYCGAGAGEVPGWKVAGRGGAAAGVIGAGRPVVGGGKGTGRGSG